MVEIDGKETVSLKQYLRDYVDIRLAALEKATELARANMDMRLNGMNEIREAMRDQASHFVTAVEHRAVCDRLDRLEQKIRDLELSRAELSGKASQTSVMIAYAISLLGLLVGVILHFV